MGKLLTPKRIQAGLAGLLLIGVGGVVSTAAFTSNVDVSGEAVAGTLQLSFDESVGADLDNINNTLFAPGRSANESVTVVNDGSIGADITLGFEYAANEDTDPETTAKEAEALAGALEVEVGWTDLEESPVTETRLLSEFTGVDGLQIPGEGSAELSIRVVMDPSGELTEDEANALQGRAVDLKLIAVAEQNLDL